MEKMAAGSSKTMGLVYNAAWHQFSEESKIIFFLEKYATKCRLCNHSHIIKHNNTCRQVASFMFWPSSSMRMDLLALIG
jgi:hypothetical protein